MLTLVLLSLVACESTDSEDTATAAPTWHADIAPVVDVHCAGCHADGGIGGFSFTEYEDAVTWSTAIEAAVVARRMPPWSATRECGDYRYDISLSDKQIDTLTEWVEAGTPEGDPADAIDDLETVGSSLSRTDVSFGMDAAYTPDFTDGQDQYRCFVLDWPETEDLFITGFGIEPGNESIVHHVVTHFAPPETRDTFDTLQDEDEEPGYACYGGVGGAFGDSSWLGGWAPGSSGMDFAPGTGIAIEAGTAVVMQVHYHDDGSEGAAALSTFNASVETDVESEATLQPLTDVDWVYGAAMDIPANTDGVTHTWSTELGVPLQFYQSTLHMHTLGQSGSVSIEHADGTSECLLHIEQYDFNWQRAYQLAEPIQSEAGDRIQVSCTFDNPTDEDVNWGEGTSDEMCLAVAYITL